MSRHQRMGQDCGRSGFLFPETTRRRRRLQLQSIKRLARILRFRLCRLAAALAEDNHTVEKVVDKVVIAQAASEPEEAREVVTGRAGAGREIGRLRKGWRLPRESFRLLAECQTQGLPRQLASQAPRFDFGRSRELAASQECSGRTGKEPQESQRSCCGSIDQPRHLWPGYSLGLADRTDRL